MPDRPVAGLRRRLPVRRLRVRQGLASRPAGRRQLPRAEPSAPACPARPSSASALHGDTQALYYLSIFDGEVRRIVSTTANSQPTASFRYTPDGTEVAFYGAASRDGDQGDRIATWAGTSATAPGRRDDRARGVAHLRRRRRANGDAHGDGLRGLASEPVTRTVHAGEHPPTITLHAAAAGRGLPGGSALRGRASVGDPEDGACPRSSISWLIKRQHDNHVHPFLGPVTGTSVKGTYPEAESLACRRREPAPRRGDGRRLRGHATTVTRTLEPRRVDADLPHRPAAVRRHRGCAGPTRRNVVSWVGHKFPRGGSGPEDRRQALRLRRWSDGEPAGTTSSRPERRRRTSRDSAAPEGGRPPPKSSSPINLK